MPIEIRELIIRAVVNESSDSRGRSRSAESDRRVPIDTHAIIEECVRQVLQILKKSKER